MTKIILNEDESFVKEFCTILQNNDGYCPCRLEKNSDTHCMCKEFREQKEGTCHCGLYTKIREDN